MERDFDIAIVGAGASGLAAAISAKSAHPKAKVTLLEKMEEPAKKLSASGNGRGNLSNKECESLETVLQFFTESGIAVRMDEAGRIYPYSEEAKSAAAALVKRAQRLGVDLLTDAKVRSVEASPVSGEGFRIFVCIKGKDAEIKTKRLLIATGGKSFAAYGCTGDGYGFARKLGHRVSPLVPALTAVEVAENIRELKGVRAKAEVTLFESGNSAFRQLGEIQFREDSLSGICIMNMSSCLPVLARGEVDGGREAGRDCQAAGGSSAETGAPACKIAINFAPDFTAAALLDFFKAEAKAEDNTVSDLLETLVKKPLEQRIIREAGLDGRSPAAQLSLQEILNIANKVRGLSFTPTGRKGWKEAQLTKGGVDLSEVDSRTMESKIAKGLYFAGEVLDYDGYAADTTFTTHG